ISLSIFVTRSLAFDFDSMVMSVKNELRIRCPASLISDFMYKSIACKSMYVSLLICFSITKKASAVLLQQMPLMYRRIRAHEGPPVLRESLEAAACFLRFDDRLSAA